jgi:hypothetical protein
MMDYLFDYTGHKIMPSIDIFPVLIRFLLGGSIVVAFTFVAKNLGGRLIGILLLFQLL